MKTFQARLYICLLIVFINLNISHAQASRFAFLIGVGNYPSESGWQKLSAPNDVDLIRKTLLSQNFPEQNIFTLKDEAATKAGILHTFQTQFLQQVTKGSTVIFHFSGHGQQVRDDDGDEIDGFDEALVPIDSDLHFKKGENEGEQLLRDEELGELLLKLRKKLGKTGHLFVLIDACHSGTSTRGLGIARGTVIQMADENYIKKHHKKVIEKSSLEETNTELIENIAPMVSFFSSSAQELSYEYTGENLQRNGLMTYAFCKGLAKLRKGATYQGLFEKIQLEISAYTSRQTPQSEGALEQAVLGGAIIEQPVYFKTQDWISPDLVVLDAGQLHGLNPGTEVVFYPIDTRDTAQATPIAIGTVDYAKAMDCDVRLDRTVKREEIIGSWAFVRKMNYGSLKAKIQLDIDDAKIKAQLSDYLSTKSYLEIVEESPDLLLYQEADKIILINQKDRIVWENRISSHFSESQLIALRNSITAYLRAAFLRKLEVLDSNFSTKIQLKIIQNPNSPGIAKNNFKIGEEAILEITNTGQYGVYFNLFNITPSDTIEPIIPFDKPANEYYLPPGKTYIFDTEIIIGPPIGQHILKIIATPEPINLKKVLEKNGAATRNATTISNPFEVLFGATFLEEKNTRGATSTIPSGVGYIGGVVIRIEK
jgi:hypothetical protein